MRETYLQNRPPEEILFEIVSNLHRRWRKVIFIPLFYIVAGMLIARYYFQPFRFGMGLIPLSDTVSLIVVFAGGAMVMFLWYLLERMRLRMVDQLTGLRRDSTQFLSRARDHQVMQFIVCDLAAAPGVILFFCNGTLFPAVLFIFASMIFYLRSLPSERLLGRAFFYSGKDTNE